MRRFIDLLAPLGFIVMGGAFLIDRMGQKIPGNLEVYFLVGSAFIVTHLLLRFEDITRAVGARQLRYGGNTFVFSLAVFGILVLVNWFVVRHTKRWDLTKNKRFSLSDQTKKVIDGLKEDVSVTFFQKADEMPLSRERMKPFEAASHLKVSYVDPIKEPAKARALDVTSLPTIVFERGSRKEKATNDSEQDLESALIKVTRDVKKTVCFVEGEGERDIDDSRDVGYSTVKTDLGRSQYEIKKVLLFSEGKVPADCTVLVVAGPAKDLQERAVDAIRSYVKSGGRALIMVEPEFKESYPNLTGLLKEWNIDTAKDVVVDASGVGQVFGAGPITPIALQYPYHEITKDFRLMTVFHEARSMQAGKATIPGVTAQNLVETSARSWAESDLTLKDPVEFNEGKDRSGPISLGAVATIAGPDAKPDAKAPEGESAAPKVEGRVAAFGDSDFASNALFSFQGNRNFFLNTVAWLAQDSDLISIRPREPDDQRMMLSENQQLLVWLLAIVLLPGAFIVLGVGTWWRRR
jgi:ABC-type uncharacterized transport system involved in gliding motility auxiliary subunit